MQIRNLRHPSLEIPSFTTSPDQSWCLYGRNDSGIEDFFRLISGELVPATADCLLLPENPGIISFKVQQEIYEEELRLDDSDYLDRPDPGTPAAAFLPPGGERSPLVQAFAMTDSLGKGYRQLSSGQSRKLLLLREILKGARQIMLQSPYDGLDEAGCRELDKALASLRQHAVEVLVTVTNRCDIPAWCSHLAILRHGRIVFQGRRDDVIRELATIPLPEKGLFHADILQLTAHGSAADPERRELVALRDGFARFGEKILFEHLDLIINAGCHTLITGPNGCGKSTLLHIITGDNPKCYANDLRIFGVRRGSGESIWELKRHMGIVSPEIHRNHHIPGTARQVVLSGLFDSIGLYQKASAAQERMALQWLGWIGLPHKASLAFRRLGFAEQRLVLIARALIKLPRLLILDEPTQGLDEDNRHELLQLLEKIAAHQISTILYVSHRKDEHRRFFRRHIRLETYGS